MSYARKDYTDFKELAPDICVLVLSQLAAKAGLDTELLELVKIRASQINGCAFCVQFRILDSERLGMSVDKLNLVAVCREAPQFSALALLAADAFAPRRQRRHLCGGERGIFEERAGLPELGRRGDQCQEPFWRRLSLDLASAPGGACCGTVNQRAESNDDFLG
jgi:AhpD family alkylhydroperoxidase